MSGLRLLFTLAALSALAGCMDVPPKGTTVDNIEAYDVAVASLGCELVSDADFGAVEFQAGITRDQAIAITEQKLSREQAVRMDNGGVRLISGACAA